MRKAAVAFLLPAEREGLRSGPGQGLWVLRDPDFHLAVRLTRPLPWLAQHPTGRALEPRIRFSPSPDLAGRGEAVLASLQGPHGESSGRRLVLPSCAHVTHGNTTLTAGHS